MKQIQFAFHNIDDLDAELRRIQQWNNSNLYSSLLIRVYTEIMDEELIGGVCQKIQTQLPDALIIGCSSNGNILNGDFSGGTFVVSFTIFEYPSTKVEILQYPLSASSQLEITGKLCDEVRGRSWVKGVEMLVTIRGMSVSALCDGLSELPEGIQVFGGGAFSSDLEQDDACVFSNVGGYSENGIVFALLGGDDFHLETSYVTGWKPLGLAMNVTAADGAMLKELNGRPAYETYYKYLHIKNDENFFFNTLEFPFFYRHNGIDIMRAPTASNPDGSLTMTADINQGVSTRIAYGDPWTILDSVWQKGNELSAFSPESILVFSCAARRTFWGNAEVGKESEPYQIIAPTIGFYTSGEFLRTGPFVNQHNVTQVVVAMREGEARQRPNGEALQANHSFEGKVSMINRMATFIRATTEELAEANRKLEEANQRLSELAITDALTGIGNKTAYFERIHKIDDRIAKGGAMFSAAVFDLNSLKGINDTYGHECGDMAIKDAVKVLISVFGKENLYRIGGDELIAVVDDTSQQDMEEMFKALDQAIINENKLEKAYKRPLSMAKGFSTFDGEKDREYLNTFHRADDAMYRDKAEYYKTHDRRRR